MGNVLDRLCLFEEKFPFVPTWDASEVIPGFLWLGNKADSQFKSELRRIGITHILNSSDNIPNYFDDEFRYKKLNILDFGQDQGISRVFEEAKEFLDICREDGGKVLVHCLAGMNRSVTVIVVYLMKTKGVTLKEAWDEVRKARPQALPFEDNKKELIRYEKQERGKNSMKITDFPIMHSASR